MTTESRDYPDRIWAGHLGGGRRAWKPDPPDQYENDFTCEYVRADVAEEALKAAKTVIGMMERPDGLGDEVNIALDRRLSQIDAALARATNGGRDDG